MTTTALNNLSNVEELEKIVKTSLKNSVISQLGLTNTYHGGGDNFDDALQVLRDIVNNGADGGFSGFIYYTETVKFVNENKRDILDLAKKQAECFDTDWLKMVCGFHCLREINLKPSDVADAFYDYTGECKDQILNALSWFALEEVARNEIDFYDCPQSGYC